MRTTIELTEEHRAELLHLAARRGLKGFSHLVQEALSEYLRNESRKLHLIDAASKLKGTWNEEEANEFEARAKAVRSHWR
jgi:Arc/MetJ-type ribon-helix-helix transcriptional regulator